MPREMVEGGGGRRGAGAFFRGGCGSGGVILVFTRTPGESYRKRVRVLLLYLCAARARARVCVCVCVSERATEREREREYGFLKYSI